MKLSYNFVLLTLASLVVACGSGTKTVEYPEIQNLSFEKKLLEEGVTTYDSGEIQLQKLRIGDVNNDGANDIVALTDAIPGQQILIYYQGQNGLEPYESIGLSDLELLRSEIQQFQSVEIADIDSDGVNELLITADVYFDLNNTTYARLLVLKRNASNGSFYLDQILLAEDKSGNSRPYAIGDMEITDANADGLADVVVLYGQEFIIYYQNEEGSLEYDNNLNVNIDIGIPDELRIITSGDLNNDGLQDIVTKVGGLNISVAQQLSSGFEVNTHSVTTDYWPSYDAFTVGDISGDLLDDIVVVDPASAYLNIFTQDQIGDLEKEVIEVPNNEKLCSISIIDFNNDGIMDLVGETSSLKVNIYLQDSEGSFNTLEYQAPNTSIRSCHSNQALVIGDVTGDNERDVILTDRDQLIVFTGT